tara:strand:- start:352 stop:630 length:279 start_codon:yes stop_codon:yes gene_type:complete
MENFFVWLLKAPLSEIIELLEKGELEVFATDAYKDGEFIRFEIGFATQNGDWFMVHPNYPRWQELKSLPFQEIVRIPFQCLLPSTQDLVLAS